MKKPCYKPRDNDAKGECVLISLLDHLKYLDTKDKLPEDIPVKNIIEVYERGMTRKDAPVKSFIQGLKEYMTQESVFELVSKAVGGETEISDKMRVRRGDEDIPIKDKYVKYIQLRADGLDNIDPNNQETWCDIFILWCSSLWLQLPIMVVELSGSSNLLELQLDTKEGEIGTTRWCQKPAKCDMREIEPCFMYLHWAGHPLSLVPEKGREKDWARHYMYLEPLDDVDSLIEWDGSIEASRKLYDRWNNFQDVGLLTATKSLRIKTANTLKRNGFSQDSWLVECTQGSYNNCTTIAYRILLEIINSYYTSAEFHVTQQLIDDGELLGAYVKKEMSLRPGANLSMFDITQVFPAFRTLMKNDGELVNWDYNPFDIREDDLMEVFSEKIFSEKNTNELRVASE